MDKKMVVILVMFACFFGIFYFMINNGDNKNDNEENSNIESNSNEVKEKINSINNIELYVTDFKYNDSINGYNYTKIPLNDEVINNLKNKLLDLDLNTKVSAVVYGKYKLVIDNRVIYFDPSNDYALYMNNNYEINFSNELKKLIIEEEKLCSCCVNNNCNLNLCGC